MAAAIAVRNMLQRMSLSIEAATQVTAIDGQNLSDVNDLLQLEDKDIETLCRVIRRPGGTNAAGNANPGISVSAMAEANLKRMIYELRHVARCSRTIVWGDITLVSTRKLVRQAEMEGSHRDPVALPTIEPKNWPKTFEAIDEYFRGLRGCKGHPLSYCLRTDLVPAAAAVDPATGVVGSAYISHDDEMIARGPILEMGAAVGPNAEMVGPFSDAFLVDRTTVWEKLAEILLASDSFTVIKTAKVRRDGRLAYKLLYAHYLGPNNVDYMAGEAEKTLASSRYDGEKRNWGFEKYALLHLKQHQILEGLIPHGYNGIDPGSKVRHLNAGIKTNTLDAVKSRIISDEHLRADFARCVTLYKDFVKQTVNTANVQMGIAALHVAGAGKGEDRWYTHEEWADLPEDEQAVIRKARAARKKKGGGDKRSPKGKPTSGKFGRKQFQQLEKKVQNQKRQLAALHAKNAPESDEEEPMKEGDSDSEGNRKHSALTRQPSGARKGGRTGKDSKG